METPDTVDGWLRILDTPEDMKESHPVEVSEFARARGIADEPAFEWWVPYILQKRDVILAEIKDQKDDAQVWYRVANHPNTCL